MPPPERVRDDERTAALRRRVVSPTCFSGLPAGQIPTPRPSCLRNDPGTCHLQAPLVCDRSISSPGIACAVFTCFSCPGILDSVSRWSKYRLECGPHQSRLAQEALMEVPRGSRAWWKALRPFMEMWFFSRKAEDVLGGPVVKNQSANSSNTDLILGPGRAHMPLDSWARGPQLLSSNSAVKGAPAMRSPLTATRASSGAQQRRPSMTRKKEKRNKYKFTIYNNGADYIFIFGPWQTWAFHPSHHRPHSWGTYPKEFQITWLW